MQFKVAETTDQLEDNHSEDDRTRFYTRVKLIPAKIIPPC